MSEIRLQFLEEQAVEIHGMLDAAGISRAGDYGDLSITARLSGLVDKYNAKGLGDDRSTIDAAGVTRFARTATPR